MTQKPGEGSGHGRVVGERPLAMRAQDDRGPAYNAAVERSEAAFRHVRGVLGAPKVVDTAGDLAALAAALPPDTALTIEETVRVAVPGPPGEGWVSAVVATMVTMAERPLTPVRDRQGREHDVLVPGLQLGTWVLPGAGAPVPADSRAYGYYGRMVEALDLEGPAESLPAVAAAVAHIAALLSDNDSGPAAFLPFGSPVAAQITAQVQRLLDVAVALAAPRAAGRGRGTRRGRGLHGRVSIGKPSTALEGPDSGGRTL